MATPLFPSYETVGSLLPPRDTYLSTAAKNAGRAIDEYATRQAEDRYRLADFTARMEKELERNATLRNIAALKSQDTRMKTEAAERSRKLDRDLREKLGLPSAELATLRRDALGHTLGLQQEFGDIDLEGMDVTQIQEFFSTPEGARFLNIPAGRAVQSSAAAEDRARIMADASRARQASTPTAPLSPEETSKLLEGIRSEKRKMEEEFGVPQRSLLGSGGLRFPKAPPERQYSLSQEFMRLDELEKGLATSPTVSRGTGSRAYLGVSGSGATPQPAASRPMDEPFHMW